MGKLSVFVRTDLRSRSGATASRVNVGRCWIKGRNPTRECVLDQRKDLALEVDETGVYIHE